MKRIDVLQYSSFFLAFTGFSLLSFNVLLPGLIVSLVGDIGLIAYGHATKQWGMFVANIAYGAVISAGIINVLVFGGP